MMPSGSGTSRFAIYCWIRRRTMPRRAFPGVRPRRKGAALRRPVRLSVPTEMRYRELAFLCGLLRKKTPGEGSRGRGRRGRHLGRYPEGAESSRPADAASLRRSVGEILQGRRTGFRLCRRAMAAGKSGRLGSADGAGGQRLHRRHRRRHRFLRSGHRAPPAGGTPGFPGRAPVPEERRRGRRSRHAAASSEAGLGHLCDVRPGEHRRGGENHDQGRLPAGGAGQYLGLRRHRGHPRIRRQRVRGADAALGLHPRRRNPGRRAGGPGETLSADLCRCLQTRGQPQCAGQGPTAPL